VAWFFIFKGVNMSRLNIDLDFTIHPKTMGLISIIGETADAFPIRMWSYLGKFHAKDGIFHGCSAHQIEGLIRWKGEPGALVAAMVDVGFLDIVAGGEYQAHDWFDHEGHIHAWKVRGKNNAKKRWGNANSNANSNASSNASGNATCREPSRTVPTIPDQPTVPTKDKVKSISVCATKSIQTNEDRPGLGVGGEVATLIPPNEQEANQGPSKRFQKPTAAEVEAYVKKMRYTVDWVKFWNHYESNGWMVGRVPMKNWRAAVVTWSKGGNYGGEKTGPGGAVAGRDGLTSEEVVERRERLKRLSEGT
jgi:hypothetical protein